MVTGESTNHHHRLYLTKGHLKSSSVPVGAVSHKEGTASAMAPLSQVRIAGKLDAQ